MINKEVKLKLQEYLKDIPIIDHACKKAGISRATFYRWRSDDKKWRGKINISINEGYSHINELCEAKLISLIKDGKLDAIKHWQHHHDKRYYNKLVSERIDKIDDLVKRDFTNLEIMGAVKILRQMKADGIKIEKYFPTFSKS
jgi:hypothetical protein